MFKKILLATCLLVTSMASQAALISHYGYERNSTSSFVKGGGLEWVMWDLTKGKTFSGAFEKFAGWRLATNDEMVSLFNSFGFGNKVWNSSEKSYEEALEEHTSTDKGSRFLKFIELFGSTYFDSCTSNARIQSCYDDRDPFQLSSAAYGSDLDNDFMFKRANIIDDATHIGANGVSEKLPHVASLTNDRWAFSNAEVGTGFAIVGVFQASCHH